MENAIEQKTKAKTATIEQPEKKQKIGDFALRYRKIFPDRRIREKRSCAKILFLLLYIFRQKMNTLTRNDLYRIQF